MSPACTCDESSVFECPRHGPAEAGYAQWLKRKRHELLRHNYLRRVEAERREQDARAVPALVKAEAALQATEAPRWRCRHCGEPATVAVRSGFEDHPECEGCAAWRMPSRHGPLSDVLPDYTYWDDEPKGTDV
jgi:hypothetical protein